MMNNNFNNNATNNNSNNNSNNGGFIMAQGTITTMEAFAGTVKSAMEVTFQFGEMYYTKSESILLKMHEK